MRIGDVTAWPRKPADLADERMCRVASPRLSGASYCDGVLNASAESISRDLVEYGEDDSESWMLACSEDDLARVCSVADWLLLHGPTAPSGASMTIAKACALAAVYVREGAPRELRRSRRRKIDGLPPVPMPGRRPDHQLQMRAPRHYGVGDDARAFWST